MITSMLCWGSWANTRKLTAGYSFSLFYWDYVLGIIVGSLVWGFTLGSLGDEGTSFVANLHTADFTHDLYAVLGGVIFNVANLLTRPPAAGPRMARAAASTPARHRQTTERVSKNRVPIPFPR
jgi:glucose uptake protein